MARTLVDTSVLVAYYNEEDSQFEKAQKVLPTAERPLVIHEYVAVECINILMKQIGKEASDAFIASLLNNSDFELLYSYDTGFTMVAAEFKNSTTKQLSFTDTALLSLSSGYDVLTFDEALNRAIKKKAAR